VGDGEVKQEIENLVKEKQLKDVILLAKK